jgi:hypothetical protein
MTLRTVQFVGEGGLYVSLSRLLASCTGVYSGAAEGVVCRSLEH